MMKYDIFISYRREGGDSLSQLLYDRLSHMGYNVFLDIESLRSGKFNEKLLKIIEECNDVILVLPPKGLDRCNDPEDWVYQEITHALKCDKNVIPVLMRGFSWPDTLPEELRELQYYNGIQDSKDYFDAFIDKLTKLLISKPSIFSNISRRRRTRHSKKSEQSFWKRYKKAVVFAVTGLMICAGIFAGYSIMKSVEEERMKEMVVIDIYAAEDMSANDFYEDADIVKTRFDILCGTAEYEYTVHENEIQVTMPVSVFHEEEASIETVLDDYIVPPTEMYVSTLKEDGSLGEYVHINRSDMTEVQLHQGQIPDAGDSQQDEGSGKQYYIGISLTDEAADKVMECLGNDVNKAVLMQDLKEREGYYLGYELNVEDESNTVFFEVDSQHENIARVVEHIYKSEPITEAFEFDVRRPVNWQKVEKGENAGEFQVNERKISSESVTLRYEYGFKDEPLQREERKYIETILKKRLDTLQTPYALGYEINAQKNKTAVVKVSPEKLNEDIAQLISTGDECGIESLFYDSYYIVEKISCSKNEDGTYVMNADMGDYVENAELADDAREIKKTANHNIYLNSGGVKIASVDAEEALTGASYSFDNLSGLGVDKITEEYRYLLDLIQTIHVGEAYPQPVYLETALFNGKNEEWGVSSLSEKQTAAIEKIIISEYDEAEVYLDEISQAITVDLNMDINETLPEKANEAIKNIYEICNLKSGEIEEINIYCVSDKKNIIMFRVDVVNSRLVWFGSIGGEKIAPYEEMFREIVENDEFYQSGEFDESVSEWYFRDR